MPLSFNFHKDILLLMLAKAHLKSDELEKFCKEATHMYIEETQN